jgi:protocatechuate 3,4-dioxygenase beta subunit
VLDEYGRAIPGVGLSALPIQETVYTDAEGRFSFAVPNRGLYVPEAHHSDWGGARVEVTAPASGVEVRLEARAGVEVRVRANGQGVEGASLVLWGGGSTFHSDRPSDADGRVVMRGIPPGTYALSADHPRFLPSEKRQVTLEDGKPLSVTVDLREGAPLLGEVVDERGRPVPGVWVSAFPEGASPATTDGAGRFKLEPLWPERPYRLEARHPRYELRERALVQPGGERVRLVLREKTRVHGRVVDEDGVPIKRFEVDTEAVSTADGRFEVFTSPTEDGETLIISAPGHEPAIVDVPGSKNLGDVVLPRSPRLTGVVRDEHGGPVADAVVGCSSCDVQATTDEQGRFSLPRAAGDRSVSVVARRGRLSGTREVSNPSAPAEVVIRQSVRLTGRVFLPDGSPAAGKQVEAFEGDRSELVAFVTGADGSFSADVPPGSYRIPVNPGVGDMGVPLLFVRVDGAEKRLDLGPAPGTGSLTVRVDQQPGYALWVVPGTLSQVGEPPMELMKLPYGQMVYQPESGTVRVQGLAPGRYTVVWASHHANTPGGPVVRTVDVGGPTELSLVR